MSAASIPPQHAQYPEPGKDGPQFGKQAETARPQLQAGRKAAKSHIVVGSGVSVKLDEPALSAASVMVNAVSNIDGAGGSAQLC